VVLVLVFGLVLVLLLVGIPVVVALVLDLSRLVRARLESLLSSSKGGWLALYLALALLLTVVLLL
jgi:hypothetical protein